MRKVALFDAFGGTFLLAFRMLHLSRICSYISKMVVYHVILSATLINGSQPFRQEEVVNTITIFCLCQYIIPVAKIFFRQVFTYNKRAFFPSESIIVLGFYCKYNNYICNKSSFGDIFAVI